MDAAKPIGRSLLHHTWAELRRRRVVRAGAAYGVFAFFILQLAEITFDPLGLPPLALTWTVLGAVLGFPVVLVLSWYFDITPRGIVVEQKRGGAAGAAFALAVVLLAVGGSAWWLFGLYAPARDNAATTGTADEAAVQVPVNAVAVLPFDDMSPARDSGYLADGIAEELLDRLARNPGLRVAARTSSFALRGKAADVREIGRLLNVRWVLEGSLRRTEGRVRITAQLIDASNGFHVWSQPYDRDDTDLFALQDEIADAIAKELSTRIAGVTAEAPGDTGTANADALQAYLQGRQAWRQRTPASLDRAEFLFRRAVELDPAFARAWSGLADTYLLQADYGNRSLDDAIALAEPAVVQAVNLQPQLGEAWASLGLLRMNVGQNAAAQRSLEEAMRLDPRYEMAPMWLASVYARAGQPERQREVLLRALELNPLEPVINVNLAGLLAGSGNFDEARAQLQRVLAIVPQEAALLRALADIEQAQGNFGAALRAAEAALATDATAPANIETLLRLLTQIEAFDRADTVVRQLPAGHRNRALGLQEIEIRRGGTRVLPELTARIASIPEHPGTPVDRQTLALGGMAQLRAGNAEQAAAWLRRAAGSPQQLDGNAERFESASLLLTALQALRQDDEATRWQQALDAAVRDWLRRVGNNKDGQIARVLLALQNGDVATAESELQKAFDGGFRGRWVLLYDPRFAALRDRPIVRQLVQSMDAEFTAARNQLGDRAG